MRTLSICIFMAFKFRMTLWVTGPDDDSIVQMVQFGSFLEFAHTFGTSANSWVLVLES
jgi:hypothetical protein